jgi:hypothetical protein
MPVMPSTNAAPVEAVISHWRNDPFAGSIPPSLTLHPVHVRLSRASTLTDLPSGLYAVHQLYGSRLRARELHPGRAAQPCQWLRPKVYPALARLDRRPPLIEHGGLGVGYGRPEAPHEPLRRGLHGRSVRPQLASCRGDRSTPWRSRPWWTSTPSTPATEAMSAQTPRGQWDAADRLGRAIGP